MAASPRHSLGKSLPTSIPKPAAPASAYAFRIEALRRAIAGREAYVMRYARRTARLDDAARARDPIQLEQPPAADPPPPIRRTGAPFN